MNSPYQSPKSDARDESLGRIDFKQARRLALLYWEVRRLIWNILIAVVAIFIYMFAAGVAMGIGDPATIGYTSTALYFFEAAVTANICYSFVYVYEFLFTRVNDDGSLANPKFRMVLFIAGCLIGIIFAAIVGREIALLQYPV